MYEHHPVQEIVESKEQRAMTTVYWHSYGIVLEVVIERKGSWVQIYSGAWPEIQYTLAVCYDCTSM